MARTDGFTQKTFAADGANRPIALMRLVVPPDDVRMAQIGQVHRFVAELRQAASERQSVNSLEKGTDFIKMRSMRRLDFIGICCAIALTAPRASLAQAPPANDDRMVIDDFENDLVDWQAMKLDPDKGVDVDTE